MTKAGFSDFNSDNFSKILNYSITAICFLTLFISFYFIFNTRFEFSMKQFYPMTHPLLQQEEKVSKLFKLDKSSTLILLLQTNDHSSWLESKNYNSLKTLTELFKSHDNLNSVISMSTIQASQNNGDQLDVGSLLDKISYDDRKKISSVHPFLKPHLIDSSESSTLILLKLNSLNSAELHDYSEKLKNYFKNQSTNYQVNIGGLNALQADIGMLLKKELVSSIVIGLVLFIFGLALLYKHTFALFSVILTLFFVNTTILGGLAYLNIPLNILLSTLPILISLTVISLVIHIQGHYNKSKNIFITYSDLFWENLLSVFISGIGFLILKTSSSLMIQNYGIIIALSSFAAWFLTHLVYWPLSFWFKKTDFRIGFTRPAYWLLKPLTYKKSIIAFTFLVFIFGAYSITKLNWNSKALDDLPEFQETRKTTEYIDKHFGGTMEIRFLIQHKIPSQDWNQALQIQKLDKAVAKIKKISGVGSALSANDFYKTLSETGAPRRVPASNSDLSEKNFLFSLGSSNPLDALVSEDKKSLLVNIRYQDVSSEKIKLMTYQIKKILQSHFPKADISFSGFAEHFHTLNQEISKDLVFSFWQALFAAFVFLILVFRSFRFALLACLPNMLPPFALLLWLNLNQVPLKPTVAIIFSIAIGLAFTNTVYILGRILKLQKKHNYKNYLPLKRALLEEGNSCLIATVLVLLGFVVFLFSYFGVNKMFGEYMILSVIAALIGDLIFMPSFILQFRKLFMSLIILLSFFSILEFNSGSGFSLALNKAHADRRPASETNSASASPSNSASASPQSNSSASPKDLLKRVQKVLSTQDDSAKIKMKIIEADGNFKERELLFKRKFSNKKNQTLVKILKPSDQKGAGFLSVIENSKANSTENRTEQQWIYLPQSKQVRRFVSKNKEEGVLGSELSPQDLDLTTLQSAKVILLKNPTQNAELFLLEVTSASNSTRYSKAILWIKSSLSIPERIDYYDQKGQVIKRIDFQNYVKVNNVQRAQKVIIKNLKNRRSTELTLSEIKANSGLSDDAFTQRALSKD